MSVWALLPKTKVSLGPFFGRQVRGWEAEWPHPRPGCAALCCCPGCVSLQSSLASGGNVHPPNAWQLRSLVQASEVYSPDKGSNLVVVNELVREEVTGVFREASQCR